MTLSLLPLLHNEGDNFVISTISTKGAWKNEPFKSFAEAEGFANRFRKTHNVYIKHAVHDGVLDAKQHPDCHKEHFPASRNFTIDIDVGDGKSYATIAEGEAALIQLIRAINEIKLPEPNQINATGGGFHVVWSLLDLLPAVQWKHINDAMYNFFREKGIKIDNAMGIIDRAVRVCDDGFVNVKYGVPRPTKTLRHHPIRADVNNIFNPLRPWMIATQSNVIPMRQPGLNDEYKTKEDFTLDLDSILTECSVLNDALLTGGKPGSHVHDRTYWIHILGIISKAGDEQFGLATAHMMGANYPNYDEDYTVRKFYEFRKDGKGYTNCDKFINLPGSPCFQCQYRGQVNSPAGIQGRLAALRVAAGQAPLTSQAVVKSANIDDGLPGDKFYNSLHGLMMRSVDDKPDLLIWPMMEVRNVRLLQQDTNKNQLTLALVLSGIGNKQPRDIKLEMFNSADARTLAKQINNVYSITMPESVSKGVHMVMGSWVETIRNRIKTELNYTQQGWTEEGNFTVGEKLITPSIIEQASTNFQLTKFNSTGNLHTYQQVALDILGSDVRPEAHLLVAASLAAPLISLVGLAGFTMNFHSHKSAYGKTTLAKLSAGIWAKPEHLMFAINDTQNAVVQQLGTLRNLPGFFDDLRATRLDQFLENIVFRMGQGSDKRRLNRDAKPRETKNWSTMLIFTTNFQFSGSGVTRTGEGDAAAARYLDVEMPKLAPNCQANALQILAETKKIDTNHGLVGQAYMQNVLANKAQVRQDILSIGNNLMKQTATGPGDVSGRNHATAMAACIIGSQIANKLGLLPIQPSLVIAAVANAIKPARVERARLQNDNGHEVLLTAFLAATAGNRIITSVNNNVKTTHTLRPMQPLTHEINRTAKELIISKHAFVEWLVKTDQSMIAGSALRGLAPHIAKEPRQIAADTEYRLPRRDVIVLTEATDWTGLTKL